MTLIGFYLRFSERLDPSANARLLALVQALLSDLLPGISDIVPGYVNVYVEFDAERVSRGQVERWLKRHLRALSGAGVGRQVEVPVRYDGIDLPWVAAQTGLSVEEVVRLHSQPEYRVFATGFTPGFPFLGPLDERLRLPRRSNPRPLVPAHAVAVAGNQTGIYPLPSPGGWHLIGTALVPMYDPHRAEPFYLQAGDRVRLVRAEGPPPALPRAISLLPLEPRHPVLQVEEPGLLDLVVDQGRRMGGRLGLAMAGALDGRSARNANALLGNPADAPLLEITLKGPVLRVLSPVVAAFAGYGLVPLVNHEPVGPARSFALRKGDVLSFRQTGEGVRGYLALAGGIESGVFWGSASTDVRGLIGQPLQAGDVLGVAAPKAVRAGFGFHQTALPAQVRVRLLPGPQYSPEALRALCAAPFTLESGDRMGLRLEGPEVPGGELISEATPLGALQITPQGQPIVLLNDRGRIGGYAKPALVHPADLAQLAQLRPGQRVCFVKPGSFGHWDTEYTVA
ncbi:5-oxoprolinase subunit PxpB [Calidithermus timidus]|jgi:KipI family sensor histidine kinase inhibitor|uniref:5-oxoprolinase subunit PxpB n=1 Tax=Calidithermus timidus TaxID=307124 RepID=UPI00035C6E5A|nr:5-oxoprolinase subunit PxpB [Calidithermus timidus]